MNIRTFIAAEGKIPALRYKGKVGRRPDQKPCFQAAVKSGNSGDTEKRQMLFNFLAAPRGTWDLSSPTRDRTHVPCIGSVES